MGGGWTKDPRYLMTRRIEGVVGGRRGSGEGKEGHTPV